MTDDIMFWFDLLTAALWFAMSLVGIVLRARRLLRLHRIVLSEPVDPEDRAYLRQIIRSTWLRLGVKVVFLLGSIVALTNLPLWGAWRIGIVLALGFMLWETISVDRVRDRLGRHQEQQP